MRALLLAIWLGSLGVVPALAQDPPPQSPAPAQNAAPAVPQPAPAAPAPVQIDLKLAETLIYYYVNKDPNSLPLVFTALKSTDAIMRSGLSRASLAGFLSMVFVQNRARVEGWIGSASYPPDSKAIIEFALWQSGNIDLISGLFHERPDFITAKPGNLFSLTPRSAVEMDLKWGAFYATGNPGFLAAMADALDTSRPLTGSRELDVAIRTSSAAGLTYNMRQHEVIERYIRQRDAEASGQYKQLLDLIIAQRTAELKPAPDHDGEFSGLIATVKLPDGAQIAPPPPGPIAPGGGPDTARRGDTIGVTVFFSGMQLAQDLSADVSYDIKITDPSGKVDTRSAQTDVAALKERVPARFNVLDSRSTLSLHFEPDDKSGPYRIDVLLKDNIGGRKVALTRSIELVDK